MSKVDIEIDVDGANRVGTALRNGLDEGLDDAGSTLLDHGIEKAEDQFTGGRMVWQAEVRDSFEKEESRMNRFYNFKGKIFNPIKHADVVDRGLAPAGEITGANPSVQDLMPWVVSNLSPADYEGGGGSPDLQDFNGGDGPAGATIVNGIQSEDRTIEYVGLDEFGLEARNFASEDTKAGYLGDGTSVVWKSQEDNRSDSGVTNEVVWSHAQEELGFDLGPKSREETAQTFKGETDGTIQEIVDGEVLKQTVNEVPSGRFYDTDKQDLVDFVAENREWFAQTNAVDYIVGNSDRHSNNIMVNEDGNPRGIDNGGATFKKGLNGRHTRGLYYLTDFDKAIDEEKLFTEAQTYLDRSEGVLDELLQDEDFKNSIIAKVKEVHGADSKQADRIEKIIGDEIGPGHALYEGDTGVPLYKRHIQKSRNLNTIAYGEEVDPEDEVDESKFVYGPGSIDDTDDTDDSTDDSNSLNFSDLDDIFGELSS